MDFATILQDAVTFNDNIELTVGNEKVTLGDIRNLSRRQQEQVTNRMNELQREREEVKTLATKAAELLSRQEQPQTRQATQQAAGGDDWDTDPFYAPIRTRISPLEKQLKEALDAVKQTQDQMQRAALIWANDRFAAEYRDNRDRLKGDKYKDWRGEKAVDKLAEYAAEHKLVDRFGMPSVSRAIDELTKEDEVDRIRKQAREEGIEEGKRQQRVSTMQRPTSASGGKGAASKGLDPTKNFEDLGDSVAEDPELVEMLSQIGGLEIQ